MARYDVFLVSSRADRDKAEMILRRLRALKFKVRYDKKREHTAPTPRDLRDASNSGAVLILWSKAAVDKDDDDHDWVEALAEHAGQTPGALVQATLDGTAPDAAVEGKELYTLTGLGPRKLVEGYIQLVEGLGKREGREDLRDWLSLKASDKDGKEVWKENHPTDPLSQTPKSKVKTPPAAPVAPVVTGAMVKPAVIPPITTSTLNPPKAPIHGDEDLERVMLLAVSLVLALMLLMSGLMGSRQITMPAIGNTTLVEQCPPGQLPAYLLDRDNQTLEPGGITDDTDPTVEPDDDEVLEFDLN